MSIMSMAAVRAVLPGNALASSSKALTFSFSRCFSSTPRRRNASGEKYDAADLRGKLSTAQQRAFDNLRPVIEQFDAPIDLALAYGSGVIAQANAAPGPPPMTDFIVSTPNARAFHAANMRQHPDHYPLFARLLGPGAIAWMTDNMGAGLWYVTMVKFGDLEVKYGVISTSSLVRDLEQWETLYVAGRLHKPVLFLASTPGLQAPLGQNTRAALSLALLQLPSKFQEIQLWEKIAGISYSGDPRMSVPGAENPEKVRNIVRGPGVLQGFRGLYAPHVGSVGLRLAASPLEWKGQGEEMVGQPEGPEHQGALLAALPLRLRVALAKHFRPTLAGAMVDPEVREQRREVKERRKSLEVGESRALYDDAAFWVSVARQPGFIEVLNNEVRHVIKRPALTQSMKGLMTAGFKKSFFYSAAKFRKWLAGRKK